MHCTTVNNTAVAGKDFTAINRVISWANGDGADKECNVTLSDATPFTGQKTFYIRLSGASGAPLGTQSETMVTIYGNKDAGIVSLSAATYTVTQKAGSATITVNRTVNAQRRRLRELRHRQRHRHGRHQLHRRQGIGQLGQQGYGAEDLRDPDQHRHLVHGQQDRCGRTRRCGRRKHGVDQIRHRDDHRGRGDTGTGDWIGHCIVDGADA